MDIKRFQVGANMVLDAAGIKDRRQRTSLLEAVERDRLGRQQTHTDLLSGDEPIDFRRLAAQMTPSAGGQLLGSLSTHETPEEKQTRSLELIRERAKHAGYKPETEEKWLKGKRAGRSQINIGMKELRKMKVNVKSPKFYSNAIATAKKQSQDWDLLSPNQQKIAIREQMDFDIRGIFGDEVDFDVRDGVLGWYESNGKLIRTAD